MAVELVRAAAVQLQETTMDWVVRPAIVSALSAIDTIGKLFCAVVDTLTNSIQWLVGAQPPHLPPGVIQAGNHFPIDAEDAEDGAVPPPAAGGVHDDPAVMHAAAAVGAARAESVESTRAIAEQKRDVLAAVGVICDQYSRVTEAVRHHTERLHQVRVALRKKAPAFNAEVNSVYQKIARILGSPLAKVFLARLPKCYVEGAKQYQRQSHAAPFRTEKAVMATIASIQDVFDGQEFRDVGYLQALEQGCMQEIAELSAAANPQEYMLAVLTAIKPVAVHLRRAGLTLPLNDSDTPESAYRKLEALFAEAERKIGDVE